MSLKALKMDGIVGLCKSMQYQKASNHSAQKDKIKDYIALSKNQSTFMDAYLSTLELLSDSKNKISLVVNPSYIVAYTLEILRCVTSRNEQSAAKYVDFCAKGLLDALKIADAMYNNLKVTL